MPAHIDNHRLRNCGFGNQAIHHPDKDPFVALPLPTVVERLRRPILARGITAAQAIADDKDYPAQNPPIIHTRLASQKRLLTITPVNSVPCIIQKRQL
jgi:hypothetical protein